MGRRIDSILGMEEELVEIRVVEGFLEAEILKSKLESFGIPCMLKSETAKRLFGLTLNGLGKVKIIVQKKFRERAEEILNEET